MRRPTFSTRDLAKALTAVRKDGLRVSRIEIEPHGRLTLMFDGHAPDADRQAAQQSLDELRARLKADSAADTAARRARRAKKAP